MAAIALNLSKGQQIANQVHTPEVQYLSLWNKGQYIYTPGIEIKYQWVSARKM